MVVFSFASMIKSHNSNNISMVSKLFSKIHKFASINGIKRIIDYLLYQSSLKNVIKGVIIVNFHKLYHYSYDIWDTKTFWFGARVQKCPVDLWVYQEIIYKIKPNVILETGTFHGGSALFLAQICDLVNKGNVISIDSQYIKGRPSHKRIRYILGSSTSDKVLKEVRKLIKDKKVVMVVLDSDHRKEHVLKELKLFGKLVTKGSYLIVEDTNLNGHPIDSLHGPGPMEAVWEFLRGNTYFVIDKTKEKFLLTCNPNGYLLKVK